MNADFWFTLTFSGLGAGLVAIMATLAVERLGGLLGGIISTLPTTIVPASWGLWSQLSSSAESGLESPLFSASMYAVPAGMWLNALFLWLWRALPPRLPSLAGWRAAVVLSGLTLTAWAIGASLWITLAKTFFNTPFSRWVAALLATSAIIACGMIATYHPRQAPRGIHKITIITIISRGTCACLAVGFAVYLSRSGESTFSGIAAVFPAIFWTTMVSLWLSQGEAVPSGAVGPMMLGSSSVAVFALSAPKLYPLYGPTMGALLAWLLSGVCAAIPSYLWVKSRAQSLPLRSSPI